MQQHKKLRLRMSSYLWWRPWSELPKEILELIVKRLAFVNIVRMKSVCSSWNQAVRFYTASPSYVPLPEAPWLMFPQWPQVETQADTQQDKTDQVRFLQARRFFSLTENKSYNINVRPHHISNYMVVGSSEGWLVILSRLSKKPFIINPFSSCIIPLPTKVITSKSNDKTTMENIVCISKATVPPHFYHRKNFCVFVLYGFLRDKLAYIKGTNETWIQFCGRRQSQVYVDIICHNGLLFALAFRGCVQVRDFRGRFAKYVTRLDFSPTMRQLLKSNALAAEAEASLVESMGELLLVLPLLGESLNSIGFVVYKLDYGGKRWQSVETLPNQALFMSKNGCVSMFTPDLPELRENSIYFINEEWDLSVTYNIGIYDLKEKRIVNQVYDMKDCKATSAAPFWFVPNPWIVHHVDHLPLRCLCPYLTYDKKLYCGSKLPAMDEKSLLNMYL